LTSRSISCVESLLSDIAGVGRVYRPSTGNTRPWTNACTVHLLLRKLILSLSR
jgi:hypothetical protein